MMMMMMIMIMIMMLMDDDDSLVFFSPYFAFSKLASNWAACGKAKLLCGLLSLVCGALHLRALQCGKIPDFLLCGEFYTFQCIASHFIVFCSQICSVVSRVVTCILFCALFIFLKKTVLQCNSIVSAVLWRESADFGESCH